MRIFTYFVSLVLCFSFVFNSNYVQAQSQTPTQAELQKELDALEAEIAAQKKVIQSKQSEGKSLSRDIAILDSKIKQKEAEIKLRDKNIKNISYDIREKEGDISDLSQKMDKELEFVGNTLRKMNTDNNTDFMVSLLSSSNFSESVDNINNLNNLKSSLKSSIEAIKNTKNVLEDVTDQLSQKKDTEQSLKSQQEVQKKEINSNKAEKADILKVTKGEEKKYQALMAENQKKASEIRAKLFSFQDGTEVKFGDLYQYSKSASAATGVRTEFILAILEQESGLGTNLGQCYVADDEGSLVTISSGSARGSMKPDSLDDFKEITSKLGRDFNKTRVSCALSYGYGGAMGMAQFMPSTWMMFESQIASSAGVSFADPWKPSQAIMGSAYLLSDNGASSQTYQAERNAACRYYSGRVCSSSSAGAKYGDQVMSRIQDIQDKIAIITGN